MLKKSLSIIVVVILVLLCCVSCEKPVQYKNEGTLNSEISNVQMPSDFSFKIVWGTYGTSSYDSQTGKLVITKATTDVNKYTSHVKMSDDELKTVYKYLFSDIDIMKYPESYDPFNAPESELKITRTPNQTLIISVTANGQTKTVTCDPISYWSEGYSEEAKAFLTAEDNIVRMITSFPEWLAFPDYEFHFD